jgi:hypothetical protein
LLKQRLHARKSLVRDAKALAHRIIEPEERVDKEPAATTLNDEQE